MAEEQIDPWKSLASDLGMDPSAEPPPPPKPTAPPANSQHTPTHHAAPPKKAQPGWASLANEFGIEVPAEEESAAKIIPPKSKHDPVAEALGWPDLPAREPEPRRSDERGAQEEDDEWRGDRARRGRSMRDEAEGRNTSDDDIGENRESASVRGEEGGDRDRPRRRRRRGGRGRGRGEGRGDGRGEGRSESRVEGRGEGSRDQYREPGSSVPAPREHDEFDDRIDEPAAEPEFGAEPRGEAPERGERDSRRRRGRRGRGGRRGSGSSRDAGSRDGGSRDGGDRPAGRTGADRPPGFSAGPRDEDDLDADFDEMDRLARSAEDEGLAGISDDDHDDEHEEGELGDRHDVKSSVRDIVTWKEAIGMIIDGNMQSRAHTPQQNHHSHHGSRGRGRGGRGGRGRGRRE